MDTPEITEIEDLARAANLPLERVLAHAGVATTTWWRWKNEKYEPRIKTLRKLRLALDELSGIAA